MVTIIFHKMYIYTESFISNLQWHLPQAGSPVSYLVFNEHNDQIISEAGIPLCTDRRSVSGCDQVE